MKNISCLGRVFCWITLFRQSDAVQSQTVFIECCQVYARTADAAGSFLFPIIPVSYTHLYFKLEPLSPDRPKHNFWFDETGHIRVKNPSAFWLPEFTLQREICLLYTSPQNFHAVYQRWKMGEITGTAAAKECGMPLATFRYRAEIYEKAKLL